VVAWNKLAELCSQLLAKGRKIYVEGRLKTNSWQGQDGAQRSTTEVIIEDMIILDSKRPATGVVSEGEVGTTPQPVSGGVSASAQTDDAQTPKAEHTQPTGAEEVNPDDIPF